jgi:hemoglobin
MNVCGLRWGGLLTALLVLFAQACATPAKQPVAETVAKPDTPPAPAKPAKPASLYERIGGLPAIEAVVTDFQQNVAADDRINAPFGVADLKLLHRRLVEFVCVATGGPCQYTGRDMRASHKGMGVTNEQFDVLVGALVKSLDKFKVPEREKSEILGALGPLRGEIVEVE